MFIPFAFFQNPVIIPTITLTSGYYIGGNFTTYAFNADPYFRMLDSDGFISSSFNIGAGFNTSVRTAVTQSDGKIVIGGDFTTYSGSTKGRIVRLNTNGTADTGSSFNIGTAGFNGTVNSISIQSNQKIIAGGAFSSYSGSGSPLIIRINSDGTKDTTFNPGAGTNNIVLSTAIQSDQKIIIGGAFISYSGSATNYITRLNTNGTADTVPSWNQGVGFNSIVSSVAIQSDQKIVIGGQFTTYAGSSYNRIVRLNTDGTRDSTFNPGTAGFNGNVVSLTIQSDQKIVVGGAFTTYSGSTKNYITRLNTNGTADTGSSFNIGAGFNSPVISLAIQPDGKILVQGLFTAYSGSVVNGVARINTNGTLDTTFNRDLSINTTNQPSTILPLSNGSIILGGSFTGNKVGYMTFLDQTGNVNTTSSVASYGFNGSPNIFARQSDGKLIVGGQFTFYSGSEINRIVRLNTNNTTDTTFNIGVGFNSTVNSLAIQSNQKVLVGGAFTSYSGSASNNTRIIRLNTDGTKDTTFNPGTAGFNGTPASLAVQSDQKIVAGGGFTLYSGSTKNRIVRINTDGTIDPDSSFNIGVGFNNTINSLAIQADQKIVVGGSFITYSGSTKNYITRLNTNGTADTGSSWNQGAGLNLSVNSIAIQNFSSSFGTQTIIAGGTFTSYSGSIKNRIVRLNANGTADTGSSWNQGVGFNSSVASLIVESGSEKIIVGGGFTTYSGSTANRIIRLNTDGTLDKTFIVTGSGLIGTTSIIPFD